MVVGDEAAPRDLEGPTQPTDHNLSSRASVRAPKAQSVSRVALTPLAAADPAGPATHPALAPKTSGVVIPTPGGRRHIPAPPPAISHMSGASAVVHIAASVPL